MSVCVSSSLSSGMTHASHLHLTSTLSMMQSFQSHHQMAPSSSVLGNSLEMSHAQQTNQQLQLQNSSSSSSSDANEPNSEMLLALIARNKTLEGESASNGTFFCLPSEKWKEIDPEENFCKSKRTQSLSDRTWHDRFSLKCRKWWCFREMTLSELTECLEVRFYFKPKYVCLYIGNRTKLSPSRAKVCLKTSMNFDKLFDQMRSRHFQSCGKVDLRKTSLQKRKGKQCLREFY